MEKEIASLNARSFGGFWLRIVASLIDTCIVMSIFILSFMVIDKFVPEGRDVKMIQAFYSQILFISYYGILQALIEGTPGKLLLGLKMVSFKGTRLSIWRSVLRYFLLNLGTFFFGLMPFSVLWHPQKRGLHDLLLGSMVIRKDILSLMRAAEARQITETQDFQRQSQQAA